MRILIRSILRDVIWIFNIVKNREEGQQYSILSRSQLVKVTFAELFRCTKKLATFSAQSFVSLIDNLRGKKRKRNGEPVIGTRRTSILRRQVSMSTEPSARFYSYKMANGNWNHDGNRNYPDYSRSTSLIADARLNLWEGNPRKRLDLATLVLASSESFDWREKSEFLSEGIRDSIKHPPSEISRAIMFRDHAAFRSCDIYVSSRYIIVAAAKERSSFHVRFLQRRTFFPRRSMTVRNSRTGNGCGLIKGISLGLIKCVYTFAFPRHRRLILTIMIRDKEQILSRWERVVITRNHAKMEDTCEWKYSDIFSDRFGN